MPVDVSFLIQDHRQNYLTFQLLGREVKPLNWFVLA